MGEIFHCSAEQHHFLVFPNDLAYYKLGTTVITRFFAVICPKSIDVKRRPGKIS
jgi:hypothetical protein